MGYYLRFIPSFADFAEPLVALTGRDVPFVWRPACATAFLQLWDALVRGPTLAFPTESGDYILDTDASNFGLGGVLSQIQNDDECVIAYCSHTQSHSEDADLVPIQSGEDWVAQLDDDLSRLATQTGEVFRITALQLEDATCITLLEWIRSDVFPPWAEVKSLCPEIRFLWHHRNNLSADTNGVIWRKRSSQGSQLQLLVPRRTRESLFLAYYASLFGGHLGRNHTLARLSHRFYWSGMADDVKDWLKQCTMWSSSPAGQRSHRSSLGLDRYGYSRRL